MYKLAVMLAATPLEATGGRGGVWFLFILNRGYVIGKYQRRRKKRDYDSCKIVSKWDILGGPSL